MTLTDRYLTVAQTAARLRITKQGVLHMIATKKLAADKVKAAGSHGFMYLIPRKAVDQLARHRRARQALAGCVALCGLFLGAGVASASPVPLRTTEVGHVGTFFGCPTFLAGTAERFALADGTAGYFDSSASSGCTFLPTTINTNTFPVTITGFQINPTSTVFEYSLYVTAGSVNSVATQFPDLVVDTGVVAVNYVQICCPGPPLGTWDPQTQALDVSWSGGLGGRSFLSYYVLVSPDVPILGSCLVSGSTSQSVPCLNPDPVETAVPEPTTLVLLGAGLALGWARRTNRRGGDV